MLEALEKLLGKKPTVAKVNAAIQAAHDERATLTARQMAIIDQMAIDDSQADALTAEHAGISLRLAALDKRAGMLSQERTAAAIREIGSEYEAQLKAISSDYAQLAPARAKTDAALEAYRQAAADEQRLRSQINHAQHLAQDIVMNANQSGAFDRTTLQQALNAIKAKYPSAGEAVGQTNEQARQMAIYGFNANRIEAQS